MKKGDIMIKKITGTNLAGMSSTRDRVENDFYATDPKAVEQLFEKEFFGEGDYLEPCVGQGHISNKIKQLVPNSNVDSIDLVDRGYPDVIVLDFLAYETTKHYDYIISNPPYSLAKEFTEKGLSLLKPKGKMALFLKIQFLEGEKRRKLFEETPPKYIYVFTKRMATFNNGSEVDEKGKRWATTMCHAWFVWEKGFNGETVVRWI